MFKKILIANRGEIALRIIRTCKEMGIKTVVPFSDSDRYSIPVTFAEESYPLYGNTPRDTYLNIDKIIEIAKKSGAEAIHPGYGFLSENALLAKACLNNGLIFIGPPIEVLEKLGDKVQAKIAVKKAGIPVVRGVNKPIHSLSRMKRIADMIGYPVIIKAVMGGGGRGMRVVTEESSLERAYQSAMNEALTSFNDNQVFIEKFIDNPRHIEVQVLADSHGNFVHLFERDCTIQRRHQKLVEEAPSSFLTAQQRRKLGQYAIKACQAIGYENAGTVEFLVDSKGEFYFIETNARIQVEHPVTEVISGVNLIREQIRVAAGEKLTFTQKNLKINGHAIECRINAEDTKNGFVPSTGIINDVILPGGNGIRVDTAVKNNSEVTPFYDSMIVKVIAHAEDRETTIKKMLAALAEMKISGVETTISFLRKLMLTEDFR
ncbi:MAG: acetyl-CoA carboxylase biotin carboxylase subunit, partial [Oligoflexia bacterium]|nr:acetyl-CoA carboxylase biotin carboxylase subunit [Oligoflexia bacterium]